jgi:hypothetical protein
MQSGPQSRFGIVTDDKTCSATAERVNQSEMSPSLRIEPYSPQYHAEWDRFVSESQGACFIFQRTFMDYHSQQYEDCSLMIKDGNKLLGLIPAHRKDRIFISHHGLSFGGWIYPKGIDQRGFERIVTVTLEFLRREGFEKMQVRQQPAFYSTQAWDSQESLVKLGFEITAGKPVYGLALPKILKDRGKRWGVRKAERVGLRLVTQPLFERFWQDLLESYHLHKTGIPPVHSLSEIQYLAARHPDCITQQQVFLGDELLAGTTLFHYHGVTKVQYLASSERGRKLRAVDLMMQRLIETCDSPWLDLGGVTSPLSGEEKISLSQWKESWGAQRFPVPTWEIRL